MRFEVRQHIEAPPEVVVRAYADPRLYESFGSSSKLGAPEVLSRDVRDALVDLRIRYQFTGHLSSAARAILDPAKLSWVEHSTHDLEQRTGHYRFVPDHYADRFECDGRYRCDVDGAGTKRTVEGRLVVRALLVGSAVEGAIISGLRDHLGDEVAMVERFLRSR